MKINSSLPCNIYKAINAPIKSMKVLADKSSGVINVDTISISPKAVELSGVNKIAQTIARDIDAGADDNRIEALRDAIKNNRYHVSADDVAAAILSRAESE